MSAALSTFIMLLEQGYLKFLWGKFNIWSVIVGMLTMQHLWGSRSWIKPCRPVKVLAAANQIKLLEFVSQSD